VLSGEGDLILFEAMSFHSASKCLNGARRGRRSKSKILISIKDFDFDQRSKIWISIKDLIERPSTAHRLAAAGLAPPCCPRHHHAPRWIVT
jgi:hypothetical protein